MGVQSQRKTKTRHYRRPDDVAAKVLQGVLKRIDGKFNKNMIEDVIGTAFPEGLQGQNIARTIALRPIVDTVPGRTVNRYCSSGLQTIAIAANKMLHLHQGCTYCMVAL